MGMGYEARKPTPGVFPRLLARSVEQNPFRPVPLALPLPKPLQAPLYTTCRGILWFGEVFLMSN